MTRWSGQGSKQKSKFLFLSAGNWLGLLDNLREVVIVWEMVWKNEEFENGEWRILWVR